MSSSNINNVDNIEGYLGYKLHVDEDSKEVIYSLADKGDVLSRPIDNFVGSFSPDAGNKLYNSSFGLSVFDFINNDGTASVEYDVQDNFSSVSNMKFILNDNGDGFTEAQARALYIITTLGTGDTFLGSRSPLFNAVKLRDGGLASYQFVVETELFDVTLSDILNFYKEESYDPDLWGQPGYWAANAEDQTDPNSDIRYQIYQIWRLFNVSRSHDEDKSDKATPLRAHYLTSSPGVYHSIAEKTKREFYEAVELLNQGFGEENTNLGDNSWAKTPEFQEVYDMVYAYPPPTFKEFMEAMENFPIATTNIKSPTQSAYSITAGAGRTMPPDPDPESALQEFFGYFITSLNRYDAARGDQSTPFTFEGFGKRWVDYLLNVDLSIVQEERINNNNPDKPPFNTEMNYKYKLTTVNSGTTYGELNEFFTTDLKNMGAIISGKAKDYATFEANFPKSMENDFLAVLGPLFEEEGFALPEGMTRLDYLNANFKNFIHFIIDSGFESVDNYDDFITLWNYYIGSTAALNNPISSGSSDIMTYKKIFDAFYPDGDPEHGNFVRRLTEFTREANEGEVGFFNPSLLVDQWFDKMAKDFYVRKDRVDAVLLAESESLLYTRSGFDKPRMLRSLYVLLAEMVETLQTLTVAQSQRLDFFGEYQKAYADLAETVPHYMRGDASNASSADLGYKQRVNVLKGEGGLWNVHRINSDSNRDAEARSETAVLSSQYVENLRSFRTGVADLARLHQAAIAQSNEAVNQQTYVATQILQQLYSLTQSIFK
ncbi:hypothetical protein N9Y92_03145 [Chlamydiales bacterium]|nr:hypothetical protein [Chlamydiales bacterium]